jgi:hypothetical protein
MTRYDEGSGSVVFSGFDIWGFRRGDCERLVDAVLQGMWHLHRVPVAPPEAESEPVAVEPSVRVGGRPDR